MEIHRKAVSTLVKKIKDHEGQLIETTGVMDFNGFLSNPNNRSQSILFDPNSLGSEMIYKIKTYFENNVTRTITVQGLVKESCIIGEYELEIQAIKLGNYQSENFKEL